MSLSRRFLLSSMIGASGVALAQSLTPAQANIGFKADTLRSDGAYRSTAFDFANAVAAAQELLRGGDYFKLFDLESYNGTFVNGIPVKEQALAHADQLRVGKIELLFLIEEGEEATSGHLIRWDDFNPLTESAKQLRPEVLLRKTEQALIASPEAQLEALD